MTPENQLSLLNLSLPVVSSPKARYANFVQSGNLLFVSGKGPLESETQRPCGKLGQDYTTSEGQEFARLTALEILAVVRDALGSLDRVKQVVKIQGFVNATPGFDEHHLVLNGCSDLLLDVFGDKGRHARSVLGAVSLRGNLPVIIESVFEVES